MDDHKPDLPATAAFQTLDIRQWVLSNVVAQKESTAR